MASKSSASLIKNQVFQQQLSQNRSMSSPYFNPMNFQPRKLFLFALMQEDFETALQDPTDFLPANYKYLRLTFSKREYILPYPHELFTFRQIAKMLVEQVKVVEKEKHSKLDADMIEMKLEMGAVVNPDETIKELRIKLCRKKIDGIRIYAEIVNYVCDEAALNVFMPAEVDYQSSAIEKTFLLLNNQQPFYISLKKDEKPKALKSQLAEVLAAFYAIEVKSTDIRLFDLVKSEQELQGIKWSENSELNQAEVMKKIKEKEAELVGVRISQNLKVPNPQIADQRFLTIRLDSQHAVRFKFANISKYKVYDILKILKLQYPESHSLKIGDQIFRPVQLMEQMRRYFETQSSLALNIEATLVSERQTFYSCLEQFSEPSIKPDMIDKSTEQQFTKCVERARSCAESTISSELNSDEKIRPITFYTGSFRILDQQGPVLLYKGVNELLREQPFGMYQSKLEDYNKEWKYIFAAELIKSIRSLPEYPHQDLYRGIPLHKMQGEVGQIYESKQFLSATVLKNKAIHFLKRSNSGSLLKIRGLTGRYIAPYSIYPEEKEVLFMPYTRFRITEKDISDDIWKITLEEIVDKDYSSNICTYILWVDDKLKEAKKVIASLNFPIQNTFFIQLVSNQKLREWIESNPSYIINPRLRIAIISNMKRTENGVFMQDAGAHTALLVRQLIPNCPFIFYIGNVDGTKQALKQNKIDIHIYPITNKRQDLRSFIQKICVPVVEEKKESLLERQKENWLKFFNSQISSTSSS